MREFVMMLRYSIWTPLAGIAVAFLAPLVLLAAIADHQTAGMRLVAPVRPPHPPTPPAPDPLPALHGRNLIDGAVLAEAHTAEQEAKAIGYIVEVRAADAAAERAAAEKAAKPKAARRRQTQAVTAGGVPAILWRIADCESGMVADPWTAKNPRSTASGRWQFLNSTWLAWRGSSTASQARYASPAEQTAAAVRLFNAQGTRPWNASASCWRR